MKISTVLVVALALGGAAYWAFAHKTGPGSADHHGNPFRGYPAVSIGDLPGHLKQDVRIEGRITRQCPAAGCWFFLADKDGREVKVEMGDTTPKLPQSMGKTATVEGKLIPYGDSTEFIGTAVEFR